MAGVVLWINKSSSSPTLSHSSTAQRSAVQSLVQRGRPRKRKTKPGGLDASQPPSSARPKELYDLATRSMSATLDPFDSASTRIDYTAHGLLRYYVYYMHPSMWPNEPMSLGGAYAYKSSIVRIMETAIRDSLMMFCLLASATCRLQYVDSRYYPNVSRNEALYSNKALQLMRFRAGGGSEQSFDDLRTLLQCIAFLMSAESYRDNATASRTHLKAALALVDEQIGGLQYLGEQHLQGQLLMADLYLACVELKPCICDCFYDPGPAAGLHLQTYELTHLPSKTPGSTTSDFDSSLIAPELKNIREDILESHRVKSTLKIAAMAPQRAMETSHWITYRNMAIRNRLLALNYQDPLDNAFRIALIMWTLLSMNITGRLKTVKIMAYHLQSAVGMIVDSRRDGKIMLWMLLVGFGCSPESSELQAWFMEQIRTVDYLNTISAISSDTGKDLMDLLEDFQREYLYDEAVQKWHTFRLAESLRP